MSSKTSRPHESFRTTDELACEYLRRHAGIIHAPNTSESYDSNLKQFEEFLNGLGASVLSAEFEDIVSFVEHCVRRGNRDSTIQSKLSSISQCYRYIRLRTDAGDSLRFDPLRLQLIDLSEYRTPERIEREALTREELGRLFDAFQSYRNKLMAIVAAETGLRNSDIRNLKIDDIDGGTITVRNPKGGQSYIVPISEDLEWELQHWIRTNRKGYAKAETSEYVFPGQNAVKLHTNGSLNTIIREAAERAGLQDSIGESRACLADGNVEHREHQRVVFHTLRHTFVTLLSEDGVDLQYRQLLAGHRNPETTLGYDHSGGDPFETVRQQFTPPR